MKVIAIIMAVAWAWIVYQIATAPLMDDDGNIIKRKKK
jgi:hypothetical protein